MPELPEVETIRRGVAAALVGATITHAESFHPRAIRHTPGGSTEFSSRLAGRSITEVARRGKFMWALTDDDQSLIIHLGMSGQILVRDPDAAMTHEPRSASPTLDTHPSARHLRARLALGDGSQLWFVDQRTFGYLTVSELAATADSLPGGMGTTRPMLPEPVSHIARDLLDDHLDISDLVRRTRAKNTDLKRALLDQTLVSGIGNIYADEGLWQAQMHGGRQTSSQTTARLRELYTALTDVLMRALEAGGTSFDALYVNTTGESGYFERSLNAYGRAGLPCHRCGGTIRREVLGGRATYSCPRCQRRSVKR